MKINQFMSAHLDNMTRQNRYEVELHGPGNIRNRGMRCTNIALPGKQIVFAETTEYGGGPMRKHANKVDYGGGLATMTFLCDHTFEDKQLVELLLGGLFKKYKRKLTTKVNRKLDEELFGN